MTGYTLPPPLLDPSTLPPVILTSEPGSFAHNTLKVRVPAILRETIALNDFPDDIRADLDALHAELVGGVVRGLREDARDRVFWDAASAPYVGHSWLDVPWYWAEAFFYRRVLEGTRYFQPGPWQGFDPYRAKKETEWAPDAAPAAVDALLAGLSAFPPRPALSRVVGGQGSASITRFQRLLHASLWGNRADLSYTVAAHLGSKAQPGDEQYNLLVDDSDRLWDFLQRRPRRLALIADNAGTELLMDLALIDGLLTGGLVEQVHLHLKPQPFFVSDAMPADVMAGLDALAGGGEALRQAQGPGAALRQAQDPGAALRQAGGERCAEHAEAPVEPQDPGAALRRAQDAARALGARVREYLRDGRLRLVTHWFYATSLFYFQLPSDLHHELASMDLVIVKGDANYRRLLGDAHWPPATSFAQATAYFPAPLVALRTLKGEIIVGLREGEAERLRAEDPAWLVNGQRGVIQAKL